MVSRFIIHRSVMGVVVMEKDNYRQLNTIQGKDASQSRLQVPITPKKSKKQSKKNTKERIFPPNFPFMQKKGVLQKHCWFLFKAQMLSKLIPFPSKFRKRDPLEKKKRVCYTGTTTLKNQ